MIMYQLEIKTEPSPDGLNPDVLFVQQDEIGEDDARIIVSMDQLPMIIAELKKILSNRI